MKKIDFPLVCDVIFYAFCAFLLTVGILRYYRLPAGLVFGTAALLTAATGIGAFALLYRSHSRKNLSRALQKRREDLMLHLTLEESDRVCALLADALGKDGCAAEAAEGTVLGGGKTYVPLFTMQPVSADAVAMLLKKYRDVPFTLLCNTLTPEAQALMRRFGREALTGDAVLALLERTGCFPSPLLLGDLPRPKLKARLKRTFSKQNARPFFVSGVFLLIMSLFVLFPLYYLIAGSLLLLASVLIRAFGVRDIRA